MKDLGSTPSATAEEELTSPPNESEKPRYPSLNLTGDQAAKAGLNKCAHGDEYEVTIKIRATRIGGYGDDSDGPSMEFDVIGCDDAKEATAGDDEDQEAEEVRPKRRVLSPKDSGFKTPKKG